MARLPKRTVDIDMSRSVRLRMVCCPCRVARKSRKPRDDGTDDERQGTAHADDAARRHRSGSDVFQVIVLEIARRHFATMSLSSFREKYRALDQSFSPNVTIIGSQHKIGQYGSRQHKTATRGPIRKPTPNSSGESSPLTCAPLKALLVLG